MRGVFFVLKVEWMRQIGANDVHKKPLLKNGLTQKCAKKWFF